MDTTLLETEYDAVIVGTGMAEGVLAGALARVGKKVLHLDQNDYYGSNYASFPLEQFRRWTQNQAIAPRLFNDDNEEAHDPKPKPTAAPLELPPSARVVPMESAFRCHLVDERFLVSDAERDELLRKSSQFSIDVNPRLVLSSEEIVQLLIESGVGRYLEFAAIERTYIHVDDHNDPTADSIWEVPCSKKDVFASKLLGMVEKRMLMKFLQFVADYGETHILGEDVRSKNERELALGRSLKRPQNKLNQVDVAQDGAIAPYLEGPFQDLLSKHFKLSPKLQQVVVYCVALASFPVETAESESDRHVHQMSAKEGLAAVYRYVASIGRFTGNAFLVPLYGVGEITQSFCRLCAVYGGIYVLRAPIDGFIVDDEANALIGIQCTVGDNGEKAMIKAKHVITNPSYLPSFSKDLANQVASSQILRGVFLLNQSLRHEMDRFMIVIPPHDAALGNPFAIQVIQLDHGAYICPKDQYLIQVTMPLPTDWHGDSVTQQALMIAVMEKLITSADAERKKALPDEDSEEASAKASIIWQAVFAMDHYLFPYSNATKSAEYVQPQELPSNLWVCETSFASDEANVVNPLEIHLESSSVNARAIFEKICPGEAFLPKSASAEQAEREEMEDEEDAVLKSAHKLADQADWAATPSEDKDAESSEPLLESAPSTVAGV